MKYVVSQLAVMLLFSGCGIDGGGLNFGDEPSYFGDIDGKHETTVCREPKATSSLIQTSNTGLLPELNFSSSNNEIVDLNTLAGDLRCNEVRTHFSGATIKKHQRQFASKFAIEMSFTVSEKEKSKMAQGVSIEAMLSTATMTYADASLHGHLSIIELTCPGIFFISCETQEISGKKECVQFTTSYENQTCDFRATDVPFKFSDYKITSLNMSGELILSSSGGAISIAKFFWDGVY